MKFCLMVLLLCGATLARAQAEESWVVVTDLWGNRSYRTLTVRAGAGGALTGDLDGDPIAGRREGNDLTFTATASDGAIMRFTGRRSGAVVAGEADMPDTNNAERRVRHAFTARRVPDRPAGGPTTYDFTPTDFSNLFSADRVPVLTIWPGDSVRTSTIDSGGVDAQGQTRALYGNPQTGPFFVAGARPGDTLVVRLDRVRTNRDWADSLDMIVGRAQTRAMTARAGDLGRPVRWRIDAERGIATPETESPRLRGYSVPLRPMLGGIAVAPGSGYAPPSTGDTGRFGGNIDFNEVIEGNIVYLPVQQPGALLYIGDAHAAQGDGETSQFALETSMDVTLTVDLVRGRDISGPRVESPTHMMAVGQAGTMEDATRLATAGLAQWLEQDYGLSLAETALLLGSAAEYRVVTLAGQNIGMVAKIAKDRLARLTPVRS